MASEGSEEDEELRRDTREYILDMLAQLAVMARESGDACIAGLLERAMTEAEQAGHGRA